MKYYQDLIRKITAVKAGKAEQERAARNKLKKEVWEQVFCFTRLCTDVNALFEFFSARLANLAGSRAKINNELAKNGAAQVYDISLCFRYFTILNIYPRFWRLFARVPVH